MDGDAVAIAMVSMLSESEGMRAGSMIVVNFTLGCYASTAHRSPLPSRHANGDNASLFSMVSRVVDGLSATLPLLFVIVDSIFANGINGATHRTVPSKKPCGR